MGCGAENEAEVIYDELTEGFPVPVININGPEFNIPIDSSTGIGAPITRVTDSNLTTRTVGGSGTFDIIMSSVSAHLRQEYEANRITGAEYTKAYIELTAAALGNSVQFLLGKEAAYWQAVTAQLQARTAQIELVTARITAVTAKTQLATIQNEALNSKANFALTKMKLSEASITYCVAKYNLDELLPLQKIKAGLENSNITAQTAQLTKNTEIAAYNLNTVLPNQNKLVLEQIETQRSQTLDTRSDGIPVTGSVGKQKDLYTQQITSYKRDSELKVAKMFSDAWITQKTIDEGVLPPDQFTNARINEVFSAIRTNNNL